MRRFVINSSDLHENYYFFMPLVAMAWKRMGYAPISFLYGDEKLWSAKATTAVVFKFTKRLSEVFFVAPIEGHASGNLMKICRIFACSLETLKDEDYLLTSDADMIPLDPGLFRCQNMTHQIHLIGGNAYRTQMVDDGILPPKFPMCYIGGKVEAWRAIMRVDSRCPNGEMKKVLGGIRSSPSMDEEHFAFRLRASSFWEGPLEPKGPNSFEKGNCEIIVRPRAHGVMGRRLDRVRWHFRGEKDFVDCHSRRPGYTALDVLERLFAIYLPKEVPAFKEYVGEFMGAAQKEDAQGVGARRK